MNLKMTTGSESRNHNPNEGGKKQSIDLGKGSQVVLIPRLLRLDEAWKRFDYLNKEIPWTRPTICVFGRSCVQLTAPVAVGVQRIKDVKPLVHSWISRIYSGYRPHACSLDEFPPLKDILEAVRTAHKELFLGVILIACS